MLRCMSGESGLQQGNELRKSEESRRGGRSGGSRGGHIEILVGSETSGGRRGIETLPEFQYSKQMMTCVCYIKNI